MYRWALKLLCIHLLKKGKTRFLRWLVETSFFRNVLIKIAPFVRLSTYYTSMKGWKYHLGYSALRPGDIVLTVDRRKVISAIIGGEFSHAGLCVSKDQVFECAEMTHENYTKSTFADMCFQADRVLILRCRDFDEVYIENVVKKAMTFESAQYDTAFSLNNKFLYCSELVYESDYERRLKVSLEDLVALGKQYISPTGLRNAKNCFVVWDSQEAKQVHLS